LNASRGGLERLEQLHQVVGVHGVNVGPGPNPTFLPVDDQLNRTERHAAGNLRQLGELRHQANA
jgi:hypothetical protein